MKSVINGKRYDTEAAKYLCAWENEYFSGDFYYEREELYVTKNGAYFLYCEGGASSAYSESSGANSSCPGELIRVITKTEAFEWCQMRRRVNTIEKFFADMVVEA